ncbi:hypothetical protein EIH00_15885, partial [Staphylococcus aureus]
FNINNNFMVSLPIIIILLIWLSWRFYKYSKFVKMMNNLNKFGIEKPPLIVKLYNFMFFN